MLAMCDFLENRFCLANTITLATDGVLRIDGTPGVDVVRVGLRSVGDGFQLTVRLNNLHRNFDSATIRRIDISTQAGADDIQAGGMTTHLSSGSGNDRIVFGVSSGSVLDSGSGNDRLKFLGNSMEFIESTIRCGTGVDVVDCSEMNPGDQFDFPIRVPRGAETFYAPFAGDDYVDVFNALTIQGTDAGETIVALQLGTTINCGNDTLMSTAYCELNGEGGDDALLVAPEQLNSNSVVTGGDGNDSIQFPNILWGDGARSVTFGHVQANLHVTLDGLFNDGGEFFPDPGQEGPFGSLNVADDIETVVGGPLDDFIEGNDQPNILIGDGGNDMILGHRGADTLRGGAGNDTLLGGVGRDQIEGNSGNDSIHGGSGDDRLFGGSGNDTLTGGGGRDLLDGQAGDDRLLARDTLRDSLVGGGGFDRAQRDNSAAVKDLFDGIEAFIP